MVAAGDVKSVQGTFDRVGLVEMVMGSCFGSLMRISN